MTKTRYFAPIFAILLILGLAFSTIPQADAAEPTIQRTAYAELNCNWQGYTKGLTVEGQDLTWATGSGSSRKYIRAQRMANLLKNDVKSSLYGLTECDTQMMTDLAKLMGSQWKFIGGDNDLHNRTGWMYDSTKWKPGALSVTNLPGDPDGGYTGRRLLQVGFFRIGTPSMLSVAMIHLSSGNPEARDLQMDAALDKIGTANRLLAGDINASSSPAPGEPDSCRLTGPRWQLDCRGWDTFGEDNPTFQDYGRIDGLPLDVIAVSPGAQASSKIVMSNETVVDTAATYVADHNLLKVTVSFF